MRRYLGIIVTFGLALLVLIALSLAGNVNLYREDESEIEPVRSSFNAGPTGTRAFYQLLEESGQRVGRWRQAFRDIGFKAPDSILVLVGPYSGQRGMSEEDTKSLHEWLKAGGRALVFSRYPSEQLGGVSPYAKSPSQVPNVSGDKAAVDQIVYDKSIELLRQPTRLTRDLKGLELSRYAARIPLSRAEKEKDEAVPPPPPPASSETSEPGETEDEEVTVTASPSPASPSPKSPSPSGTVEVRPEPTATATPSDEEAEILKSLLHEEEYELPSPVVHMGDDEGAVLADYDYGKGRIIVMTDPFVIANHGIGRGANLQLAHNLLNELGAANRTILFNEYHHGYRSETNALIGYFRGTPFWWVLAQILLVVLLVIYGFGKRFARPLPLPQTDRHSPLEFVGSMASLQQAAEAYDLALENIYPKFKARLCRRLGLSVRAKAEEIAAAVKHRPRYEPFAERLVNVLNTSEQALNGAHLNDHQLVELVRTIRTLNAEMK